MEEWSMLDSDEDDFVFVTVEKAKGTPAGSPLAVLSTNKTVAHSEPPSSPTAPAPRASSPPLILLSPWSLSKPSTTRLFLTSSSLPTSVSQETREEGEKARLKERDKADFALSSKDAYNQDGDDEADSLASCWSDSWSDCWSDGGLWFVLTDSEDEELDCRDRRKWNKFFGNKRRGHKFRHHHSR